MWVAVIALIAAMSVTLYIYPASNAATSSIELGDASSFAVLAGSGITNTGATTATGIAGADFASAPTPAFTGYGTVDTSGTKHLAVNDVTVAAKSALDAAYADAAGRTETEIVSTDLGGRVFTEGVYESASSLGIGGTLTLDAQNDPNAVFIFQAGSTLTTAVSSEVVLVNGAQACNVFWQVGSSATIGVNSTLVGHVLAFTSITTNTGAVINGSLLAKNGAVTLDTNRFVNDACAIPKTVNFDSQGGSSVDSQQVATVATAPVTTRQDLPFQGWFDAPDGGSQIEFPYSPASDVTLYAQWAPNYSINFDPQSGSSVITQRVSTLTFEPFSQRAGFEFQGWFDSPAGGLQIIFPFSPVAETTLYAEWLPIYEITFDPQFGSAVDSQVLTGSAIAPFTSRDGYSFQGWFDSSVAGAEITFPFQPTSDITIYAHWVDGAISGIDPQDLPDPVIRTVSAGSLLEILGPTYKIDFPADALPAGTQIKIYNLASTTFVEAQISSQYEYLASLVISWAAPDGTVPIATSPVTVTITNSAIVSGARIYKIMNRVVTQFGIAMQDGSVSLSFTEDPLFTIAITSPDSPTTISAAEVSNNSALVTWVAPEVSGGSAITGYTVTSSGGQTCTTSALSCRVTGLSEATSYTFTVLATNAKGSSDLSVYSAPITTMEAAVISPAPSQPSQPAAPAAPVEDSNQAAPAAPVTPVQDPNQSAPVAPVQESNQAAPAEPVENSKLVVPEVSDLAPPLVAPTVEDKPIQKTLPVGQLPNTDGGEFSIWFGLSGAALALGSGSFWLRRRPGKKSHFSHAKFV